MSEIPFDRVWFWRSRLPERKGEACRVLARGSLNSCLVEFQRDGWQVITSRYAIRRRPADPPVVPDQARRLVEDALGSFKRDATLEEIRLRASISRLEAAIGLRLLDADGRLDLVGLRKCRRTRVSARCYRLSAKG